ncbi:MAG: penicillin-binding transpeptidase domain-containing protein [Saprospiraceae bacterium]
MNIRNEVLLRTYLTTAAFAVVALVIFFRAFYINVFEGDKWREKRKHQYVKYMEMPADRGNILAADGTLLATSLPLFDIRMDLQSGGMTKALFNKHVDSLGYYLSKYVDPRLTKSLLKKERNAKNRYLLIEKSADYAELKRIKSFPLFRLGQNKGGLIVEARSRREMPFRQLAFRTIGSTRATIKPIGLEGTYDKVLAGESGKKLMQKVPGNVWIPVGDLSEIKPKSGDDIVTTLDVNLQDITQDALEKALIHHDADNGTAIVMDVKTGAIKAMANLSKGADGYWEDYNYAIGASTEPGSTFKLATLMALLEDGYIQLSDTVNLNKGHATFHNSEMKDSEHHGIGNTTIQHAFEISSNVGIAKTAVKYYGKEGKATEFIARLRQFRLDQKTGIELEGEGKPFIKDAYSQKQNWSATTLPWMAHGYESQLTPLQMLTFYAAVANGGKMMKPYLVSEIQRTGETLRKIQPTVLKEHIASDKTIRLARQLLEGVVLNGTAKRLQSTKYTCAGKTGTARIDYYTKQSGGGKKFQASFCGYFPADNPVYAVIVLINNPKQNGYYGGAVAGPVFKAIADNCFATLDQFHPYLNGSKDTIPVLAATDLPVLNAGYRKDLDYIFHHLGLKVNYTTTTGSEWAAVAPDSNRLKMQDRPIQKGEIPNVLGMGLRDALFVLENRGYQVLVHGAGRVKSQNLVTGNSSTRRIDLVLD